MAEVIEVEDSDSPDPRCSRDRTGCQHKARPETGLGGQNCAAHSRVPHLTDCIAESLLETGGFRPQLHPRSIVKGRETGRKARS